MNKGPWRKWLQVMNKSPWLNWLPILVCGGLCLTSPLVGAAQWVVVSADQAPLQPGSLLDGTKPLKLATGAQVTLLAENGKTLKLTGPFAGIPAGDEGKGSASNNLQAIASLLQGHRQSASTLGVMRGFEGNDPASPPIDVETSGVRCLSTDPVVFWRDKIAKAEEVRLANDQGKTIATFTWPARQAELPIPASHFVDGNRYLLHRGDREIRLLVHKLAAPTDNPTALAAWMTRKGCEAQALALLQGL